LKRLKTYKKTSLNKSIVIFEEFLHGLKDSWRGKKILASGKLIELASLNAYSSFVLCKGRFLDVCETD